MIGKSFNATWTMLDRLLPLCLVALAGLGSAPASAAVCWAARQDVPGPGSSLTGASEWHEFLERDTRLSFPPTVRGPLYGVLDGSTELQPTERGLALFTLGAAKISSARTLLKSWAVEGRPEERRGAILGLGEMGPAEAGLLSTLVARESGELARTALFALYRTGDPDGRALITRLAGAREPGLSDLAAELEILAVDPGASAPVQIALDFLELRWEAARSYGLIDGRSWDAWLLEDLSTNQRFLDGAVYRGAARLGSPGVADQYLDALLSYEGTSRIRGAVAHMPREVSRLVEAGVWQPRNTREWNAIILEVDQQDSESETKGLLRGVRLVPGLSNYAAVLLVRAGSAEGLPIVELDLLSPDPVRRALVIRTLGDSAIKRYALTLEPMLEDPDERVRAEALVALIRLDHEPSIRSLNRRLSDLEADEFPALVSALCDSAQHPTVLAELSGLLPRLVAQPELRRLVAVALADQGRIGPPRWVIKEAFADPDLKRADRLSMVRVLGDGADQAELEILRGMFPVQDDLELNIELALALLRNRDPGMLPLLRKALWRAPRSRSLLAAALIIDIDGIDSLRTELAKPPADSRQSDLRRVGFALGQWGGLDEVERLARRGRPNDPALQGALLGALAARTF